MFHFVTENGRLNVEGGKVAAQLLSLPLPFSLLKDGSKSKAAPLDSSSQVFGVF